jgi:hypothetical protein
LLEKETHFKPFLFLFLFMLVPRRDGGKRDGNEIVSVLDGDNSKSNPIIKKDVRRERLCFGESLGT